MINLNLEQIEYIRQSLNKERELLRDLISDSEIHQDDFKQFSADLEMIDSILPQLIIKCVAVPFGNDGTTGDSCWVPEMDFDYNESMTLDEMIIATANSIREDYYGGEPITTVEAAHTFFEEEGYDNLAGWWIIDEDTLNALTDNDCGFGSDSAVYAHIHGIKSTIQSRAIKTINLEKSE